MENGDGVLVGSSLPDPHPPSIHSPRVRAGHSHLLLMNRIWQSNGMSLPRLGYRRLCLLSWVHSCSLAHSQSPKEPSSWDMSIPMEKPMR